MINLDFLESTVRAIKKAPELISDIIIYWFNLLTF